MKVYVLMNQQNEDSEIFGVYSSKEKAIESFPFQCEKLDEEDIEEMEIDPPNNGEPYQKIFIVCMEQSGKTWGGDLWRRLSEIEPPQFHSRKENGTMVFWVSAEGLTEDEAKSKCVTTLPLIHPVWQVSRYTNSNEMLEIQHPHPSCIYKFNTCEKVIPYAVHEDLNVARITLWEYEKTSKILPGLVVPTKK